MTGSDAGLFAVLWAPLAALTVVVHWEHVRRCWWPVAALVAAVVLYGEEAKGCNESDR